MKFLVIVATPSTASFNFAIADAAVAKLQELGHAVVFHDLYREKFPPLLEEWEIPGDAELDPLIAAHCSEVSEADGFVIVHPNWWGQPPAILKGWVDRVIRPGTAYDFEGEPGKLGVVTGLLTGKKAIVFTTGDTEERREMEYFQDPLDTLWKNCIFGFCGIDDCIRRHFTIIMISDPAQRKAWLDEVGTIIEENIAE